MPYLESMTIGVLTDTSLLIGFYFLKGTLNYCDS